MEDKLKDKTENLCKMRKHLEEMLNDIIIMAKGNAEIDHELPGAIADMIKDLADAEEHIADCCKTEVEIEYKKKIIEAMEEAKKEKELAEKLPVAGYSRMHYPDYSDYPHDNYPVMGYTRTGGTNYPMNYDGSGSRMGYDSVQDISGRGRTYDAYREMKRHYTNNMNPTTQKNMMDSRDRVFDEMEDVIMELWKDLDQNEKTKYMQKGQKLMGKLQSMA